MVEKLFQDVQYAFRTLRTSPGFTAVAVLTLALGIGANTAIFSAVNAVLLRPIATPYLDRIYAVQDDLPGLNLRKTPTGPKEADDLAKRTDLFEAVGAFAPTDLNLTGVGEPQRISAAQTTADPFAVFGLQPFAGHFYTPEDAQAGRPFVAVISYGLWQSLFGGDRSAIGGTIALDGNPYRVTGVLPRGFEYPRGVEVYIPLPMNAGYRQRGSLVMNTVVRTRPGLSLEQLQAQLTAEANVWHRMYQYPKALGHTLIATPFVQFFAGQLRPVLLVLTGAVLCVLLIACANVSSLLLVRSTGRAKELAMRMAVGASRWALIRQVIIESLVLAAAGGAAGILIGRSVLEWLAHLRSLQLPALEHVTLDRSVLLFTSVVSLCAGLFFGVVPAFRASRADLNTTLKETGRGASTGKSRHRVLETFAVLQVALALVLLVGSGLLIRSLGHLLTANLGFQPEHVTAMQVWLPQARYRMGASLVAFFETLEQRLRGIPAVQSAGIGMGVPFSGHADSSPFRIIGRPLPPGTPDRHANMLRASTDYFRALGIPLLRGRPFADTDTIGTPIVSIIDEQLARQYFPNEDPIGQKISQGPDSTIIGIAGSVSQGQPGGPPKATIYYSVRQMPVRSATVVVRSSLEPSAVANLVRPAVAQIDRDVPLFDIAPVNELIGKSLGARRLAMVVMTGFAALSLALALLGVYGVSSYTMSQRTHEIGIRIALGARAADVAGMVLRRGVALAVIGAAGGVLVAFAASKSLSSLLYGITPHDPLTVIAGIFAIVVVSLAACILPARRAARVDPMVALRHE